MGDAQTEVPNGGSVPSYYALMASRYLHETGLRWSDDLAEGTRVMGHAVDGGQSATRFRPRYSSMAGKGS